MPFEAQLIILGLGAFVMGIFSGISGGGAGLVMLPLAIAVGLPPQQAVATMKMAGLGAAYGGLLQFRKSGHVHFEVAKVLVPIGWIIAILSPFIIMSIHGDVLQKIIGSIMILMAPTLFMKQSIHAGTHRFKALGFGLYSIVLFLMAVFGAGVGGLGLFVLTLCFGFSKIEANATKRAVTACMVPVTFMSMLLAGLVMIPQGIALLVGSYVGTSLGTRIALKKGEQFVTYFMAVFSVVAGLYMLLS